MINFSKKILKPKGVLVSKLFMGEDFLEVKNLAKSIFQKVSFLSRSRVGKSQKKLIYIVKF